MSSAAEAGAAFPLGRGGFDADVSQAAIEDGAFRRMPIVDWDGIFAFGLFVPILFIVQFATYGAVLFTFATLLCAWLRRNMLGSLFRANWCLLLFPALALASALWSDVPLETFKHGLEFAVTILAALLVCTAANRRSMLYGLFAAFLLYTAVSVAVGHKVDVGDDGARAFSGLNDSKNEEADMAAAGFVISIFLFTVAVLNRRIVECAVAGAAVILEAYATIAALSSGALAGGAVALLVLLLLMLLRHAGSGLRAVALTLAGAAAVLGAAFFQFSGASTLRWLAAMFDKDPTLTGRTYLWFRARDLISDHPLFGKGFAAFWQQGNLDAEGLWQFAQIRSQQGFNFHNTLYDVLVSLGWIGATVFLITLVWGAVAGAAAYIRRPSRIACFWLAMAAYLFMRMPTECVGINEFYFSTVLLFAFLGSGRVMSSPMARVAGDGAFAIGRGRRAPVLHAADARAAARFVVH